MNKDRLFSRGFLLLFGSGKQLSPCKSSYWAGICKLDPVLSRISPSDLSIRSFFQSVCIIGYTLFPLVIAAILSALHLPAIVRAPVYLVLIGWSLAAGVSILGGSGVVKNRVGLAVYPLLVFYVGLGFICFIS